MDDELTSLIEKAIQQEIKITSLECELIKKDEQTDLAAFYNTLDWQKAILHHVCNYFTTLDLISDIIYRYSDKLNTFLRWECKHSSESLNLTIINFVDYMESYNKSSQSIFWQELRQTIIEESIETESGEE